LKCREAYAWELGCDNTPCPDHPPLPTEAVGDQVAKEGKRNGAFNTLSIGEKDRFVVPRAVKDVNHHDLSGLDTIEDQIVPCTARRSPISS
jgi:hypothetical protein